MSNKQMFDEAVEHFHAGRYSETETLCNQMLSIDAKNPEVHHLLGLAHYRKGRLFQALTSLCAALDIQGTPERFCDLGLVYQALEQKGQAVHVYNQALKLDPHYGEAHAVLGLLLLQQGRFAEAQHHSEQALLDSPNFAGAHNNLGLALANQRKTEQAATQFELAVQKDPKFLGARINLGTAYAQLGRLDDAVVQYHEAVRLDPTYALLVNDHLHKVLIDNNKIEAARPPAASPSTAPEAPANWTYNDVDGYFQFKEVYDLVADEFQDGLFVEVGAFMGRSTAYLASKIKDKPIKLFVVDTWKGSGGADRQGDSQYSPVLKKNAGDIFDLFYSNMQRCGVLQVLIPLRMESIKAANLFADNSISFCMLDAAHDYDSLKADIHAWFPKVRSGGVIAGDDYESNWPGVDKAVNEFFAGKEGLTKLAQRVWFFRK
jgi:tetratricopeptide (TPR) repeat protein